MDSELLRRILENIQSGSIGIEGAIKKLKHLPYEDLGYAKVDHHRTLRQGIPEVVFAAGKKPEEVAAIARAIWRKSKKLLITRASQEIFDILKIKGARFHGSSGIITAGGNRNRSGNILVIAAGTSDIPVAEEAVLTASFLGSNVTTAYDVGVAGIHRLMDKMDLIGSARVIVVTAGMEGALPSVVGGLTDKPLIAVPTSVGYGTSMGGLAALFAMLNSCVPGIAVMNIDNGFGAACLAHRINTLTEEGS